MSEKEHPSYERAYELYHKDKFHQSIAELEQLIKMEPRNSDAHFLLGIVFSDVKQFERAVIEFNHALELDPNNLNVYKCLAITYCQKAERTKSRSDRLLVVSYYERVLEAVPGDVDALGGLALALWFVQEHERAIATITSAVNANLKNTELIHNYWWLQGRMFFLSLRQGRWRRVQKAAREIRSIWVKID
jgi:tetratricopeptide (TPR) repeat protein